MLSTIALFCAFGQIVAGVALHDFTPRVSNLPTACETLYTSQISNCQGSDFTSSKCSTSCITALNALSQSVKTSCANAGVTGENVITAFLSGKGTADLCPNAGSDTSAANSATSAVSSAVQSVTPMVGSSIMVVSSAAVSTSALMVDTSSTPAHSVVVASSTTLATSTSESSKSLSSSASVAVSTMTIAPIEATASTSGLEIATSTPASVMEATSTATTTRVRSAQETSGGSGSPFDTYSSSPPRMTLPTPSLCFAAVLAMILMVLQ